MLFSNAKAVKSKAFFLSATAFLSSPCRAPKAVFALEDMYGLIIRQVSRQTPEAGNSAVQADTRLPVFYTPYNSLAL